MVEILMMLALSSFNPQVQAGGTIQPCIWPKCEKIEVAQFQPCIWPKCERTDLLAALPADGGFEVCAWPKKCA